MVWHAHHMLIAFLVTCARASFACWFWDAMLWDKHWMISGAGRPRPKIVFAEFACGKQAPSWSEQSSPTAPCRAKLRTMLTWQRADSCAPAVQWLRHAFSQECKGIKRVWVGMSRYASVWVGMSMNAYISCNNHMQGFQSSQMEGVGYKIRRKTRKSLAFA